MADDAGLPAVMNVAAADDVVADPLLRPALALSLHDVVALGLGAVLCIFGCPFVVIFRLQVFAESDAAASRIGDLAVLDDPAF